MSKDGSVYRKLQQHLDKMPIGYPATESGVEIRVLKHLFTPKEAEIATKLRMLPESIKHIYRRVRKMEMEVSKDELKEILDQMVEKGAIYGIKRGKKGYYKNAHLIIGSYEFQVKRITREFMNDMHQYLDEAYANEYLSTKIHQLRTIPIEKTISPEDHIYTYDNLRRLVNKISGPFGVADCVCRIGHDLIGQACKKTNLRESCLMFRKAAEYYINNNYARPISKEECLDILKKAEEEGLVLQSGNSRRLNFICTCCGCCCEGLKIVNRFPNPAQFYMSTYYARVDEKLCTGCETCINRCQMNAITMVNDLAVVDRNYCIGCGLCVKTCPKQAIKLRKKDNVEVPPRDSFRLFLKIMSKKSGKWAVFKLFLNMIKNMRTYIFYLLK